VECPLAGARAPTLDSGFNSLAFNRRRMLPEKKSGAGEQFAYPFQRSKGELRAKGGQQGGSRRLRGHAALVALFEPRRMRKMLFVVRHARAPWAMDVDLLPNRPRDHGHQRVDGESRVSGARFLQALKEPRPWILPAR
jgi:hypothetical protein